MSFFCVFLGTLYTERADIQMFGYVHCRQAEKG